MPKILIADDSIAVRKVAERLLTEAGMAVSLAANGTEALAFLGRECPDLVVSDVIMPDKSGYEVCSFVRAQPNLAGIPVLLISGIVNDEVTKQAECCHADGVLKKPFQGTSLKDRVQDLLTKRRDKGEAPALSPGTHNGKPHVPAADRMVQPTAGAAAEPEMPSPTVIPQHPADSGADVAVAKDVATLRARIAELETTLHEAHERVRQMETKVKDAEPFIERVHELEKTLADERSDWEQREKALQAAVQQEQAHNQEGAHRSEQLAASLVDEQRRSEELAGKVAEVETLSARLVEIESQLASERQAADVLAEKAAEDARTAAARLGELEATLTAERQAADVLAEKTAEDARTTAARLGELEATLTAERDAATQLVQQITMLEKLEGRVKDLEARLSEERDQSAALHKTIAQLEQEAARAKELDAALIRERERSAGFEAALSSERQQAAILVQQVTEFEQAVSRARELDSVLAGERERSTQLAKRATEAEQLADQSNRRLEDMARKLAEIAGLASQLGNSAR